MLTPPHPSPLPKGERELSLSPGDSSIFPLPFGERARVRGRGDFLNKHLGY